MRYHVESLLSRIIRALTNSKQLIESGLNINPMELNDVYEHVWNLGAKLQTNESLSILQPQYRAWPKVQIEPDT